MEEMSKTEKFGIYCLLLTGILGLAVWGFLLFTLIAEWVTLVLVDFLGF